MPPGASARDGRVEQLALQLREVGDIRGRLAPARLGAAAERAEPRARRVEEDAVEAARCAERVEVELAAVADVHVDGRSGPRERLAHELGPCGDHLVGDQRRAAERSASAASTAVLPPGPAQRSSHRSPGAHGTGAASARARRAAIPRPAPGRAPSTPRRRRWGRRPAAPIGEYRSGSSPGMSSTSTPSPGSAARFTRGEALSASSSSSSSSARPSCRSAARKRADDPARDARLEPGEALVVARRPLGARGRATPRASTGRSCAARALAKPAAFGATRLASATDSSTAACVRHPGGEQLVGAEPQHVEHGRVDRARSGGPRRAR